MSLAWIILGVLAYLGLAALLGRIVAGSQLTRLKNEILDEALPSAPTGHRTDRATRPGRLEWTEAVNLTPLGMWSAPATAPRGGPAPDPAGANAAPGIEKEEAETVSASAPTP